MHSRLELTCLENTGVRTHPTASGQNNHSSCGKAAVEGVAVDVVAVAACGKAEIYWKIAASGTLLGMMPTLFDLSQP